jgi:hypothetical protein
MDQGQETQAVITAASGINAKNTGTSFAIDPDFLELLLVKRARRGLVASNINLLFGVCSRKAWRRIG